MPRKQFDPKEAMANRPLWQVFLFFLGPLMLSNVLQSLSGTINNIYLGQLIGVDALAAASVFFPIMFFFIAFVMGLGIGASVLIGQAWGAGDREKVRTIAGATLMICLAGGVIVAVLAAFYTRELMVLFGTPAPIIAAATLYARILLLGMPLLFIFMLATSVLRGVGDNMSPLWTLLISTAIGLILTPAFILGWGGLPRLGIESAAYAGVISFSAALLWLGWHLRRKQSPLAPDMALLRHIRFNGPVLKLVLRIGIPTALQMVAMALAEMVLLGLVNGFGPHATAAYGATNQVMTYVQFPAMSIAIAVSVLGAQAIGAGNMDKLKKIVRTGLIFNIWLTGGLILLCYIFSRSIIGMFIVEPEVIDMTMELLHIVLWSVMAFGFATVFSAMMRSSGTVMAPTGLAIVSIILVEVPVAWVMSRKIGLDGVWMGYAACFCAMLLLQASFYLLVWRKRKIVRMV